MEENYYKRTNSSMTTYYGKSYVNHNLPTTVINGTNFELTKKICNKCIYSIFHHDSTPPICKIGFCSLPYEESVQEEINNSIILHNEVIRRFLFIVNRFDRKEKLSDSEKKIILEDKRLLVIRNNTLCYSLIRYNCLYRIKDVLIFQNIDENQSKQLANTLIKERDSWIANNLH